MRIKDLYRGQGSRREGLLVGGGGGAGASCACARVFAIDSIIASNLDSLSIPLGFPVISWSPVTNTALPEFMEGKASAAVATFNQGGSAGGNSSIAQERSRNSLDCFDFDVSW